MDQAQAQAQPMATAQPNSQPSNVPASSVGYPPTMAPVQMPPNSAPMHQAVPSQADLSGWAAAQQLISGLTATPPSQFQAPSYLPTQSTQPQSFVSAPQWAQPHQIPWQQQAPTYSPAPQALIAQPQTAYAPQVAPQVSEPARDSYLATVSNESLAVLEHFGPEAPALLNEYATTVEQALIAQANQTVDALTELTQANEVIDEAQLAVSRLMDDNAAYQELCTNEELLAEYVNTVMGPGGPFEQILPEDQLAADVASYGNRGTQRIESYQRPSFAMSQPQSQGGAEAMNEDPSTFWDEFAVLRRANPSQAYRMLSMATPQQLVSRPLVYEESPFEG